MPTFKFLWNGIKVNGGQLQKAWYSYSNLINYPEQTITIYAKNYRRFSAEISEVFDVQNNSDSMTDYFECDKIRVTPDHPLYAQVLEACKASEAHGERMQAKREERWKAKRLAVA